MNREIRGYQDTRPEHILITGGAGFIGSFVAAHLAALGHNVTACDNFNAYYDPGLKHARAAALLAPNGIACVEAELADARQVADLFDRIRPTRVVHLAAQAGVRHSLENPAAYVQSNLVGFANVLEACRRHHVQHLVYASSSSVYGNDAPVPFREDDAANQPISFYAATKRANELMAHSYSHLYRMPASGLRFFTVYGPWGRPDMAYFSFTRDILHGKPITVFAEGMLRRDFTYIDDIVEGVVRVLFKPQEVLDSDAPHMVFNIGNNTPVRVLDFIRMLEQKLGCEARMAFHPMQPGDVASTWADTGRLRDWVGCSPSTPLDIGLGKFINWYREHM